MARTILVADDNPMIRKALCRMFEAEKDYEICGEAANGEEVIALAQKHRPDLIILDLAMPVMNGLEAAVELKRVMPEIPIILFTNHAAKEALLTLRWLRSFVRSCAAQLAKPAITSADLGSILKSF